MVSSCVRQHILQVEDVCPCLPARPYFLGSMFTHQASELSTNYPTSSNVFTNPARVTDPLECTHGTKHVLCTHSVHKVAPSHNIPRTRIQRKKSSFTSPTPTQAPSLLPRGTALRPPSFASDHSPAHARPRRTITPQTHASAHAKPTHRSAESAPGLEVSCSHYYCYYQYHYHYHCRC